MFAQQSQREARRASLPPNVETKKRQTRVLGIAVVASASARALRARQRDEEFWAHFAE